MVQKPTATALCCSVLSRRGHGVTGTVLAYWRGVATLHRFGGRRARPLHGRGASSRDPPAGGEPEQEEAYPIVEDIVDLGPMVHEAIIFSPSAPLCRDWGLCSHCGIDRNEERLLSILVWVLTCSGSTRSMPLQLAAPERSHDRRRRPTGGRLRSCDLGSCGLKRHASRGRPEHVEEQLNQGSSGATQAHCSSLRSIPQCEHRPRQSSRQRGA